jgi:hypothetical protein
MAKRNSKGQFQKGGRSKARSSSGGRTTIVRAPAPIVKVSAPRARVVKRRQRSSGGGRRSGVGGLLSTSKGSRGALALGALLLGYASKEGWLAKLPVIGKAGPITSFGLLGFGAEEFMHMKLPSIVHDAVTGALILSAFNIGFSGGQTIVGDDYGAPGGAVFFE